MNTTQERTSACAGLMNQMVELGKQYDALLDAADKFARGNKSAGGRVRREAQAMRAGLVALRAEAQRLRAQFGEAGRSNWGAAKGGRADGGAAKPPLGRKRVSRA